MKKKNMTLKKKLIILFLILMTAASFAIAGFAMIIFSNIYGQKSDEYISDITRLASNNFDNNIEKIEKITFNLLANSAVQDQLNSINAGGVTEYQGNRIKKRIEEELAADALFDTNIVSLSIISLDGSEYTIQKVFQRPILKMFSNEEMEAANGSTVWKVSDDGGDNICVGRVILDLSTQRPIGYINVVCEKSYFQNQLQDISGTYASGSYAVNEEGLVLCSSHEDEVGGHIAEDIWKTREHGSGAVSEIDGIRSYVYWGDTLENGWKLITTIPVIEVERDIQYFALFCIGITIAAMVVAGILIFLLIDRMTKPIRELSSHMKAIEEGDYSQRTQIFSDDDVGRLGQSYNKMAESIQTLIEKVLKMEISQKQAEIEFLKMQINPHFLYNTLDTISWMARMQESDDIAEVTISLAELLRATLKQNSFISVGTELKNVRNYLFIQEYRFSDKIRVEYEIGQGVRDYIVPNFILQPIVENAIIHGLEPKMGNGALAIRIAKQDEKLHFSISDDGMGMTREEVATLYQKCKEDENKESIGLKNVYRRLKIYYEEEKSLQIISEKGKGTMISFAVPLEKLERSRRDGESIKDG